MLTSREEKVKQYMFDIFIPALHEMLKQHSPEKYEKWHGNCCKQTAIFGAFYLDVVMPEYEYTVWEGIFDDIFRGKQVRYNHAWIFAKHKTENKRLLIDLARNHTERLFTEIEKNGYPKDHDHYKNMVEVSREKLDYVQMIFSQKEYITQLTGKEFLTEFAHRLDRKEKEKIAETKD